MPERADSYENIQEENLKAINHENQQTIFIFLFRYYDKHCGLYRCK